jgi:hypothetical protein
MAPATNWPRTVRAVTITIGHTADTIVATIGANHFWALEGGPALPGVQPPSLFQARHLLA